MNVRTVVHQTMKHVEHWRIIPSKDCCSHIHIRSMNMDLCRCGNDRFHRRESNPHNRWLGALSNLLMYIEYFHWSVNELDQYSMASSIEYWKRNLPIEACDEVHSLSDDLHQQIFLHNRSPGKEITSPDWSFVAKLAQPLLHMHMFDYNTSRKTLSNWSNDSRNRKTSVSRWSSFVRQTYRVQLSPSKRPNMKRVNDECAKSIELTIEKIQTMFKEIGIDVQFH